MVKAGDVVLVCGSRRWGLPERVYARLRELPAGVIVRHGGASAKDPKTHEELSADMLADSAARSFGFEVQVFRPNYRRDGGRRAPLVRNDRMLDTEPVPVLVIAFWRASSTGTSYTMEGARSRGIELEVHRA